jgi:hypothetical protein
MNGTQPQLKILVTGVSEPIHSLPEQTFSNEKFRALDFLDPI